MKTRTILVWMPVILLGAWLLAAIGLFFQTRATQVSIDDGSVGRIREGMSEVEVNGILGMPPGDYRLKNVLYFEFLSGPVPLRKGRPLQWVVDSKQITIWFDDGKVTEVEVNQRPVELRKWHEPRTWVWKSK